MEEKKDVMSNRKLIRPSLAEATARTRETPSTRTGPPGTGRNKSLPPAETNAETFYYLKQMSAKTPMVVVLVDGEIIRGWVEWYDRACIKVNRDRGPNLLLMKSAIKYMYKEEEERGSERRLRRQKEKEQRGQELRRNRPATGQAEEAEEK
jgi:sRNA-binding regulator protein Hfq